MNKKQIVKTVLVGMMSFATTVSATDIEAGKKIGGSVCAGCHGVNGVSAADPFPNLAGQKPGYIKNALKAYKEGTRKADIMNNMAANLSDQDMENVAAYFASLKPAP